MTDGGAGGGTGSKLTKATIIVCGVASLVASVISFVWVPPEPLHPPSPALFSEHYWCL